MLLKERKKEEAKYMFEYKCMVETRLHSQIRQYCPSAPSSIQTNHGKTTWTTEQILLKIWIEYEYEYKIWI